MYIFSILDRVGLQERERVDQIHEQLIHALQHCIKKNHPGDKKLLGKLLGGLVPIRELTYRANKALPKIKKDWSTNCNLDPFWEEFIEDSPNWQKEHVWQPLYMQPDADLVKVETIITFIITVYPPPHQQPIQDIHN